ncbi:speckle targeted PIP5K1A-regulated poly(A) polymerase-like isoform X2 [Phymastichus coffea]|uniref:speckle targeted PIP5K1A-regulated poly(A) polymerase-like isoform X2 n=1 Tax=Phymastichus coffea TaxID=108790 RepID=UPI00273C06D3|nr:speckle targeted PIP5K1A-regulated poly(A) polymerase-like isoform X2 [Phymastichus coffea]
MRKHLIIMKDKQQIMNNWKCEVCDYTFESEDDLKQHFLTRSHIKRNSRSNSVYISGIPQAPNVLNDLLNFLSQTGKIVKHKTLGNKEDKILVEFSKCEPIKMILSKGIHINNVNLRVNRAQMTYEDCAHNISYEAIKNVFTDDSFEEQLYNFINKISLTQVDIKMNYEPVCQELENIFKPIFPKCRIFKFGSSVTDIGFRKCDLDIYLDIGIPVIKANKKSTIGPHVLSSEILFTIVEKTIRSNYKFSRCIPIPTARVPIVKCCYSPTNVSCDISFKSKLGVYNSSLLKFYLSIDPRFRPLMIILKYWYYNCELRSYIGITKYALTILYIFYLQNLGLVPTTNSLKEKCTVPLVINGWQVNFSENLNDFEMNEDNRYKSIPELLFGFFDFYMKYDFQTYIACLCDGQSYEKKLFYEIEFLPVSMKSYKEYLNGSVDPKAFNLRRPMCVQDPTELNWNVTNNVSAECVDKFQLFCFTSANIIVNSSNNNYQTLLKDLFGFTNKSIINYVPPVPDKKRFSICPYDIYGALINLEKVSFDNDWVDSTFKLIQQYLEKVLSFQVKINNDSSHLNQTMDHQILVLICKGSHCLWKNRKSIKNVDKSEDPFQNEINISKSLLSQINLQSDNACIIDFECQLQEKKEPRSHIMVTLSNIRGTKRIFQEIANDLMYRMVSVLRKFIKFSFKNKP